MCSSDLIGQHLARRTFPWDRPSLWRHEVLAYHRDLIALRRAHPALRRGTYHRLYAAGQVYVCGRRLANDVLLIAVNSAESGQTVEVPVENLFPDGAMLKALYGEGGGQVAGGQVTLAVPARKGMVLGA